MQREPITYGRTDGAASQRACAGANRAIRTYRAALGAGVMEASPAVEEPPAKAAEEPTAADAFVKPDVKVAEEEGE